MTRESGIVESGRNFPQVFLTVSDTSIGESYEKKQIE